MRVSKPTSSSTARRASQAGGEIAVFHYAIDGLLFDRLTTPIDSEIATDDVIDALVAGMLPES